MPQLTLPHRGITVAVNSGGPANQLVSVAYAAVAESRTNILNFHIFVKLDMPKSADVRLATALYKSDSI